MARCPEEAKVQKLPYKLLLSGFVNAHSHAFQRGLRSHVQYATDTDSFWSWRDRMYRLANNLSPEGIEAVSSLAFLEMIRAGFTSVGEFHYLHHSPEGVPYSNPDELALRVVAGARRVGLRIVLLRVAYARETSQPTAATLYRLKSRGCASSDRAASKVGNPRRTGAALSPSGS
jgi:formimidoylglutamate deiminase